MDALLEEHMWENMTFEEGKEAARNCFAFLKPGAISAVPKREISIILDAKKPLMIPCSPEKRRG
ncbi:hypothetical protein [Paenibacillus sp. YN15]|uniref:hypothetical protein n=1 Tax=Paenibacillus sp. YN15 TaxID=1742774 RepID=UPI000DCEB921|nr:hypothetical protein [Paenibacillus sp. YN15]RAV03575.1 hypothetical protein DQG13_07700 [Paenibacillus sp. YN15]